MSGLCLYKSHTTTMLLSPISSAKSRITTPQTLYILPTFLLVPTNKVLLIPNKLKSALQYLYSLVPKKNMMADDIVN
ncbi:hypothetical protein ACFX2B_026463 [Malus domestica]